MRKKGNAQRTGLANPFQFRNSPYAAAGAAAAAEAKIYRAGMDNRIVFNRREYVKIIDDGESLFAVHFVSPGWVVDARGLRLRIWGID
jgi:hypothetical protein